MHFQFVSAATLLLALTSSAAAKKKVFLIRHGEKPETGNGLSALGEERAACLPNVFSASSDFDIGHIMAQTPDDDGSKARPFLTVQPLAQSLGLTVDTSCDRDDAKCVAKKVKKVQEDSDQNILICWEHKALTDLAEALGEDDAPNYPGESFNFIWTMEKGKLISNTTSEACPGLDVPAYTRKRHFGRPNAHLFN